MNFLVLNIISLVFVSHNEIYSKNTNEFLEKSGINEHLNEDGNEATILNGRLKGKFVSKNVVNLSKRKLSKSEISLLSKGLKFIPTSNTIDKAKLKIELEAFGRMLHCGLSGFSGMMKKNLILISLNQNLLLTLEIKMLQLKFI